jgi:hypothetical protein
LRAWRLCERQAFAVDFHNNLSALFLLAPDDHERSLAVPLFDRFDLAQFRKRPEQGLS